MKEDEQPHRQEPQTPSTSPALGPRRKKQPSDEDKRDTQPSEFQILGSVGAARSCEPSPPLPADVRRQSAGDPRLRRESDREGKPQLSGRTPRHRHRSHQLHHNQSRPVKLCSPSGD